jgi:hypothetical protein
MQQQKEKDNTSGKVRISNNMFFGITKTKIFFE